MKNYLQHLILFIKRLVFLLVIFQLSRLFFFLMNLHYFESLSFFEGVKVFFFGTRFDIAIICFTNILFVILSFIPGNFKQRRGYQFVLKLLFFIINGILLLFNFSDAEYFKFINKRSTADFFSMAGTGDDFTTLIPSYLTDYWYILVCWFGIMVAAWIFYPRLKDDKFSELKMKVSHVIAQILLIPVVVLFCFFGLRGPSYLPLGIIDAARFTDPHNIPLVLNTPFCLYQTFFDEDIAEANYFPDGKSAEYYATVKDFNSSEGEKRMNVVVIALESFSKEFVGSLTSTKGCTPFLDSLINVGLSFTNAFSNGTQSLEAIPAIISGFPELMNDNFITSQYSTNEISSLPSILKKRGYSTAFFHGAKNGSMGFDKFADLAQYDNYYGKDEYGNDNDYDGLWGIWDEEFLQYTALKMNELKEPFHTFIFTLSSHHPYTIPSQRKDRFADEETEIRRAVKYSDFALRRFFNSISHMPWFNNTLFVITADHDANNSTPFFMNNVGKYAIPMIFFCPSDSSLIGSNNLCVQQADIVPSIVDYLNLNEKVVCFGSSIFDSSADHFALSYINNLYQIIENDHMLRFDGEKSICYYDILNDSLLENNLIDTEQPEMVDMENKLKAIIQSFSYRMRNNKLSDVGE